MEQYKPRLFPVLIKATLLLVLFNFAFVLTKEIPFGSLSLYNIIFTGRERFPFGETRESYNLSLFDLDAMFASHILSGTEKSQTEFRVLLIGDSSVWGTLLAPEQTLAGQLNRQSISACGKNVRAYNLGYPTISLTKDLMILHEARQYQPDMIIWLTTLEAFPRNKQFESPFVANNPERFQELASIYELNNANDPAIKPPSVWKHTFINRRRTLADIFRLQLLGVLWSSTGIDQIYQKDYERALIDLESSENFHEIPKSNSIIESLSIDVLDGGMSANPVPTILINEPMLISNGRNSDIRYNFFYPRWAYDLYRVQLADLAKMQGWYYLDLWNLVPSNEFTNSAIHLTPDGESLLAEKVSVAIQKYCE